LDVVNAVSRAQGAEQLTINRRTNGKFNKGLNATQVENDLERTQLPQQKILQ